VADVRHIVFFGGFLSFNVCSVRYVLATLMLYGWSVIPFVYIQSFLCNVAATAYTWVATINILSGTLITCLA